MKYAKKLISPRAFLGVSIGMMVIGISLDLAAWFGLVAKGEPVLVVHLSTFALIFAGYGNVISAVVNKQINND